jgi:hypothetical protein
MATKKELLQQALSSGAVAEGATEDDFTKEQLEEIVGGEQVIERPMEQEPYTAPDGHVVLSQEDIDSRLPEPK